MIDHLRWGQRLKILGGQTCKLDQRTAASRTPIGHGLFSKHCPAMAANPFHYQILPDWSFTAPNASPGT